MDKNAIGYNDLCEAVGKATLNLVSYEQEVKEGYIISMLESFVQIEYDDEEKGDVHNDSGDNEGVRVIKTPLAAGIFSN
ncbi:hypothetical protein [Hafnia phage Pocitis76]|nr:hypothetical protein [Hafnia phage Pocitis76]